MPLAVQLHGNFKKVDLGFVARTMYEWHVNFRSLTPALAQIFVNHGQANLIAVFPQGPMQPHPGQPLFGGRAWFPCGHKLFEPLAHALPDRARPAPLSAPHRGRLFQIFTYRVAA